jgi:hypothetical protein
LRPWYLRQFRVGPKHPSPATSLLPCAPRERRALRWAPARPLPSHWRPPMARVRGTERALAKVKPLATMKSQARERGTMLPALGRVRALATGWEMRLWQGAHRLKWQVRSKRATARPRLQEAPKGPHVVAAVRARSLPEQGRARGRVQGPVERGECKAEPQALGP